MTQESPSSQLFQLIWPGALAAQAIYVAAKLGIADSIEQEPKSVDELAQATKTHGEALGRVLRVLTSVGVFHETGDGFFEHTSLSETLRRDHPQSTRSWALFLGSPWIWRPWGELHHTVLTGEAGFKKIFGTDFDRYMAEHPEDAGIYNEAMSAGSAMVAESIVSAYDFSRFDRIVDLGGGQGELLRRILEDNPGTRGVLMDLPAVLEGATALQAGDLADRCEVKGGNFFDGVPQGGDAYVLKGIIHGFADEDAVKLLGNCRRAINPAGRLLIIETVPQASNEPNPQKAFMDLMMLSLVPGRERSESELRPLLEEAGFELIRVLPTPGPNAIVECRPR